VVQITYLQEEIDPYWRPSKIFVRNWVLMTSVISGWFILLFFTLFITWITWNYLFFIVVFIVGFIAGYLSCFNDIGDHTPAGLLWGIIAGITFECGILFSVLLINITNITSVPDELGNMTQSLILIFFLVLIAPFAGLLGRFLHELVLTIRMDRYKHIQPLKLKQIVILVLSWVLLISNLIGSLVRVQRAAGEPEEGYSLVNLSLPAWLFMSLTIIICLIFFFILGVILFFQGLISQFAQKSKDIPEGSQNWQNFMWAICCFLVISWIVLRIHSEGINIIHQWINDPLGMNGTIDIARNVFMDTYLLVITLMAPSALIIFYSFYEVEQIDYVLYHRWR
jgi:hypothetical protein